MKRIKRKQSAPAPDKLPGAVKYRPPKGKRSERPVEQIRRGPAPVKAVQ